MPEIPRPLIVEQSEAGLCIRLPPAGFRAARTELRFALAFATVLAFLTGVFLLVLGGQPAKLQLIFAVPLALFWVGAVALLAEAWRRSRQMAIVDVVGDTLLINASKPGSSVSIQIHRDNIKALGVGPSGVVVDDEPIMALRIDLGKPVQVGSARRRALKLFRERDEAELRLVAEHLRHALGVTQAEGRTWKQDAASSKPPR